jgi:hypothetical protein
LEEVHGTAGLQLEDWESGLVNNARGDVDSQSEPNVGWLEGSGIGGGFTNTSYPRSNAPNPHLNVSIANNYQKSLKDYDILDDYSHLQNRLRPLSPKKNVSTDHLIPFWHWRRSSFVIPHTPKYYIWATSTILS